MFLDPTFAKHWRNIRETFRFGFGSVSVSVSVSETRGGGGFAHTRPGPVEECYSTCPEWKLILYSLA